MTFEPGPQKEGSHLACSFFMRLLHLEEAGRHVVRTLKQPMELWRASPGKIESFSSQTAQLANHVYEPPPSFQTATALADTLTHRYHEPPGGVEEQVLVGGLSVSLKNENRGCEETGEGGSDTSK